MTTACAVDQDLRRHQARESELDDYAEAADARADELMLPNAEFDPMDAERFDEALAEKVGEADRTWTATLAKLIRTGNDAGLRIALLDMSRTYWRGAAESAAEKYLMDERH